MARFCPLFSGSNGNCTYISASDTAILVDAGRSCKQLLCALKERQIDPSSIQALLITHEHTDHISGLKVLVDKLKIPVYASQEVLAKLEWDNLLAPGTKTVPLEHDSKVEIGGLWVNSFDTPHDSAHSLGYRVETQDGQCMVIATDLGYVTDQVREKLTGCDLVMLESNYDAGMLSCSSYPYYLKRRISSSMGHLSNEDCSLELARLGQNRDDPVYLRAPVPEQQPSPVGLPDGVCVSVRPGDEGKCRLHIKNCFPVGTVRDDDTLGGLMLTITIIAVGKLKEAWMREGCQQYLKRLGVWAQVKVVEVEEYRTPSLPSEAQIDECLEKEGQRLKSKIPKGATVIAMCIEGKQFSSVALAGILPKKRQMEREALPF